MRIREIGKKILAFTLLFCVGVSMCNISFVQAAENDVLYDLTCNQLENPLGIGADAPLLSWKMASEKRGSLQKNFRVQVATDPGKLESGKPDIWDSKAVTSGDNTVRYDGPELKSVTRYYWTVTVTDNNGNTLKPKEPAWFETGLLDSSEWEAEWITLPTDKGAAVTKYTIDFDYRIVKDDAGFIFAAKDTSNFLMWQMNTFDKKFGGKLSFRPHVWKNGGASCIEEKVISEDIVPKSEYFTDHHMQIAVDGKKITTYLDEIKIDERQHDAAMYGKIGFRHHRAAGDCDEQAAYDNIVIRDGDGKILFSDDFSGNYNNFTVGRIENGELFVENALGLQKDSEAAPVYRREFTVGKKVDSARVYVSALGLYEMEINGKRVGDDWFNPGWTAYELNQDNNNYVMYQTYDVTEFIKDGDNAVGATTGHGWYSGKLFDGGNKRYGTGSKFLCQLEIKYTDGTSERIVTDDSWKITNSGPIRSDDFQLGESYDARYEMKGWSEAGYDDASWQKAETFTYKGSVIPHIGPTVKTVKEFKPVEITELSPGEYIINLGQNIAGFARINVKGEAGTTVRLRFGEMLNADGTLYTANLRSAAATDYYTLKGDKDGETYQPRFTFHGFQYIEVTGYPGTLTADDITGIALSSLQEQTGSFETSNSFVNQLQSNITWGQRDNFISVPTDCPQRDERLGYTGDGQVFVRTASMNMNVGPFFKKFMLDVTTNQRPDGGVADWAPNYVTPGDSHSGSFGNSGWGDAVVIIPWTMYTTYGDTSYITDNYTAMKKWVDRYKTKAGSGLTLSSSAYGDWLAVNADTPKDVISTGYFAYCADLLSKMAAAVGEDEDAAYYGKLFEDIRTAFNRDFVTADGHVKGNTQTSFLIALKFNLLPTEELRQKAAEYLVADIKAKNWHLSTGFLGVAYLLPMLSEMGYSDVAYRLLLQDTYPSWMYSVKNGATTIWERWNSYVAETGSFGDVGMNSFNHYSLGSVGEWFYTYAAGIQYDYEAPAYKHIIMTPYPGGGLDYADCSFESTYGKIVSNWSYKDTDTFVWDVTVPANTTATVSVPAVSADTVTESGINAKDAEGLEFVKFENGRAIFEAGSGTYHFNSKVERTLLLSVQDADKTRPGKVSVNGEVTELPVYMEVAAGSEVKLIGEPKNDGDFAFGFWSGDLCSKNPEITFEMNDNKVLYLNQTSAGLKNLALGAKATAKNTDGGGVWGLDKLTNGDTTSTGGYTSVASHTDDVSGDPFWVEIDLGKNTGFDKIHLYPRAQSAAADGGVASFPVDFTVMVKKDGETAYQTIFTGRDQKTEQGKPLPLDFDDVQSARYIRIQVTKLGAKPTDDSFYRFQLAELGVYLQSDREISEADKKAYLNALVDEVDNQDESLQTSAGWKALTDAVTSAKAALEAELDEAKISAAEKLLEEKLAALIPDRVDRRIEDLPAAEDIDRDDEEIKKTVKDIRAAFDALSEDEQKLVKNLAKLEAVEGALLDDGGETGYKLGDVDKNGSIDINDLSALKAAIMAGDSGEEIIALGDMDKSGTIDVNDMTALKSVIISSK